MKGGHLNAYLCRVVWLISAHTLELQRTIRDMPSQHWPETWRSHAPVLARDLGVEELAAYLEHLLADRSLPVPDMTEISEIRSEEHTSELQSLMRISYAVFCLKKKKHTNSNKYNEKN